MFNMHSLKEGEDQKEISIEPAQALDEVEPLPEDCYSRPISLTEGVCARRPLTPVLIIYHPNWDVTEVFMCPPSNDAPPTASPARFPARVGVPAPPQTQTPPDEALAALQGEPRFSIPPEKKYRSRVDITPAIASFLSLFSPQKCEHNLSKPEFNPTSIKFKIQLVAV